MKSPRGELVRVADGQVILPDVEVASRFWRRLIGLQFRRRVPQDYGLWLSPCTSVHTCFVRFPIDLFMLDRSGRVLAIRRAVVPWRIVLCPRGTRSVLETWPGAVEVDLGETLAVRDR